MRLTSTDLAISVCMCGYSSNTSQEFRTFGQYVNLRENLFVTKKKERKHGYLRAIGIRLLSWLGLLKSKDYIREEV